MSRCHRLEHYDSGKSAKNDFFGNTAKRPRHLFVFQPVHHAMCYPENHWTNPFSLLSGHCPLLSRIFHLVFIFYFLKTFPSLKSICHLCRCGDTIKFWLTTVEPAQVFIWAQLWIPLEHGNIPLVWCGPFQKFFKMQRIKTQNWW